MQTHNYLLLGGDAKKIYMSKMIEWEALLVVVFKKILFKG